MVFNGHTIQNIDALDEATMNEIIVMYADGLLGNKSLLVTQGMLTAGVFNYIRSNNSSPYTLKSILGNAYGYIFSDNDENPSDTLLTFMTQAPGFNINKFKGEK
jgi:hypothetical protein